MEGGAYGGLGVAEGFFGLLALKGVLDGAQQQAAIERALDQVVLRAFAHRADRQFLVIGGAQHQNRGAGSGDQNAGKGVVAEAVFKVQIEQNDIETDSREQGHRLGKLDDMTPMKSACDFELPVEQ